MDERKNKWWANRMLGSMKPAWLYEKWLHFRIWVNKDIHSVRHWLICPKTVLAAFDNGNLIIALSQETWGTAGLMAQHSAPLMGHGDSQSPCTGWKQWRVLNAAGRGETIWVNLVLWNSNKSKLNRLKKKKTTVILLWGLSRMGRDKVRRTLDVRDSTAVSPHRLNAAAL